MKLLLFHNIATSYYKNIVFNEFYKIHNDFKVVHLAETEKIRDWKIDISDIEYPYEILAKGSLNDHSSIFFIRAVWKLLSEEKPDVVYFGGYYHVAYWTALLWAKIYKVKILLEMDSNRFDHVRVKSKELIKHFFITKCDIGLTYGELSKEYFIDLGMPSEKIVIKSNVSSRSLFYQSANLPKLKPLKYKKHFIYVGRFSEEKNLFRLLKAFHEAKTSTRASEWGLLLVGSGSQEKELKDYIVENNITGVIFLGFVDKHDLKNYYNNADVFILPSTREPWGLVTNEAMMCGLPVIISTQCGCSLDLVNGNGYTFDPFDEQELASLLCSYMLDEEDVLSQEEQSIKIIKEFTPEGAAKIIKKAINMAGEA
ncbi:MAG: glycosyltransferase family 4 protein [Bacteroidales bacterium]|nr:glycosyltransferase family 4 protein [Bacteroidales bacterium]